MKLIGAAALLVSLLLSGLAGCFGLAELDQAPCPCVAGWVCDSATHRCVHPERLPKGDEPTLDHPEQLDFPKVSIAAPLPPPWSEPLELGNPGSADLLLSRATIEGEDAAAFSFCATPPGAAFDDGSMRACSFEGPAVGARDVQRWFVCFQPERLGPHAATLVIQGAEHGARTWEVQLAGEGVEGPCVSVAAHAWVPRGDDRSEPALWDDPEAPLTLTEHGAISLRAVVVAASVDDDSARYSWSVLEAPAGAFVTFAPSQDSAEAEVELHLAGLYGVRLARFDADGVGACEQPEVWAWVPPPPRGLYVELAWDNEERSRVSTEASPTWMPLNLHLRRPGGSWGDSGSDCSIRDHWVCGGWGADPDDEAQSPKVVRNTATPPSPQGWWLAEPMEPEPGDRGEAGWTYGVAVLRWGVDEEGKLPEGVEEVPAESSVGNFLVHIWVDGEPVTTIGPHPIPEAGTLCPVAEIPWPLPEDDDEVEVEVPLECGDAPPRP